MKILVAVDFSQGSRKALAVADKIASKFNTKMIVLHVIHDPASAAWFLRFEQAWKEGPAESGRGGSEDDGRLRQEKPAQEQEGR